MVSRNAFFDAASCWELGLTASAAAEDAEHASTASASRSISRISPSAKASLPSGFADLFNGGKAHKCVTSADVEVDVGQRLYSQVWLPWGGIDLGDEFEEEA